VIFWNPNKSLFSSNPEEASFRKTKEFAFIWRSEKAIFPKPKEIAYSLRSENANLGNRKKSLFFGDLKKRISVN